MKLGCLNHTLLTEQAILQEQNTLTGWIANCIDPNMLFTTENIDTLKQRIKSPLLGQLAYGERFLNLLSIPL